MTTPDVPATERERDEHVERVTNALEEAMAQHGLAFEPVDDAAEVGATLAALLAPQEAREPDGWITIYDDLSREVVLDRVRAEAQAAQGYRVRPFVYLGAPAEATERSES